MPDNIDFKKLFFSLLFILIAISFVRTTLNVVKNSQRLGELEKEVAILDVKKHELQKDIEYRQSSEYIEEVARNDLNYAKSDETIFVVPEGYLDNSVSGNLSESADNKNTVLATNSVDKASYPKMWLELFF